jgi:hypothetical protein
MEGFIKNLRNMQLKDFDLNVAVLDTDGRRLTEETVLLDKINLRINESIPFSVKLKNAKIAKENVLRFIISYSIDDGSYYGRGSQSSFKVDAETGAAIEEQTEKQD